MQTCRKQTLKNPTAKPEGKTNEKCADIQYLAKWSSFCKLLRSAKGQNINSMVMFSVLLRYIGVVHKLRLQPWGEGGLSNVNVTKQIRQIVLSKAVNQGGRGGQKKAKNL